MSGGERKVKRLPRTQGWEEAGGEFYQESYPGGDLDLDALHQNASNLATLLPSKQNRTATYKKKRDSKATLRRRTSTRPQYQTTTRRPSVAAATANDVGSTLPDLSENLSNEERTWEEIMQIKAMPVSMAQKIEHKNRLQSQTKLRLQGLEQFKWQRRKMWQQLRRSWAETYAKMELWRYSLKNIEGNFGTGVVAYFIFIKWLMFLNLAVCALIIIFIVLPTVVLKEPAVTLSECNVNSNVSGIGSVACCSALYDNSSAEQVASIFKASTTKDNIVMQIVQGTGFMEHTLVFYGCYPGFELVLSSSAGLIYDLPLAYLSITIVFLAISLLSILKSSAQGIKERLVEGEGQFYQYCNIVFGGWDFCIQNEKSAVIKHKAVYNEIKVCLEAERREEEKAARSQEEKMKLLFIRIVINLVVLTILSAALFLIYIVFEFAASALKNESTIKNSLLAFALEFLPSICIVGLNTIVPPFFGALVRFERYSPLFVVRLTLFRTVLLRLASLAVLLASFYSQFSCDPCKSEASQEKCDAPLCWETYVGQQFYKLMLVDFASQFAVTFFINFPRAFIARHTQSDVMKYFGEQEFYLPKHVLDVVYSQTLCWLGSFFAPVIPALAAVLYFIMFYVKKFDCLVNCKPSAVLYRASRSKSLFMAVLLLSYVAVILPLGYVIAEWTPSKACGPFRGLSTIWSVVVDTFSSFPDWLKSIVFFFGTAGFAVPAFITLVLCLYYFYAVSAANKHMVLVLKNQLVLEGRDKQFLLHRLSTIIKQQQEHHKALRAAAQNVNVHSTDISSST